MAASTFTDPAADPGAEPGTGRLLPAVDAAVAAAREAHDAARALTDTVLACQRLPAEVYRYAPDVAQAAAALTSTGRMLTDAVGQASVVSNPEAHLPGLYQATGAVYGATAAVNAVTAALRNAAAWYATALPGSQTE